MVLSSAHTGVSGQENEHIPDKLDYVGSGRREAMGRILIAQGFVACFGSSAAGQKQAVGKWVDEDLQDEGLYHIMH